jgi:hypothetical protein
LAREDLFRLFILGDGLRWPGVDPLAEPGIFSELVVTSVPTTGIDQRLFARVLVAYAETGAVCEHACGDVHGEEFLEEEFGGVGDVNLGDAGFVVARAAFVESLLQLAGKMLAKHNKG